MADEPAGGPKGDPTATAGLVAVVGALPGELGTGGTVPYPSAQDRIELWSREATSALHFCGFACVSVDLVPD